ncbi:MAG: SusD/RagB family nutrient-binding outer membrane lipoprotein [Chitinophagaceae bacterium]|nr:SusD/RagB family nutrient-binding outer membrane lipoprotein [Chitinophagaceae bacterium]
MKLSIINIKRLSSYILLSLLFTACTKNFVSKNTNPTGLTDEQANADFTLPAAFLQQAQRAIIPQDVGTYQLSENLTSDSYSGYMGAEAPFRSNSNNLTYDLVDGWNSSIWTHRYTQVMNPTYKIIALAAENPAFKDLDAFARIIRVSAMARVSEKIGPVIYSQYNKLNENNFISYDSQQDIYPAFFADLESAITTLKGLASSAVSPQMKKADLAYTDNNYQNWLRFANTLRLRLALRLVYVDPTLAKTQGEAALDPANGGLLSENNQNCYIVLSVAHPLNVIGYEWSDTRMGAPIESIMGGYSDPRIGKYFKPATDPVVAGQYKGIRSGIDIDSKARYDSYSQLVFFEENKMQVMVAAESWFLKAEAALRGWANAGDAKANYETGIDRSFEMYGLSASATAYKNDATSKPKPYIDPKSVTAGQNDITTGSPHLSTITIKWEDGDSNDRKLERIITQKWIALFPDGEEAWAEYRRTGYPLLFPVVVNYSAGAIPTIPGVRRIPIPLAEYNTNGGAAEAAAATLGGPDNGATRLRWDVENKSF